MRQVIVSGIAIAVESYYAYLKLNKQHATVSCGFSHRIHFLNFIDPCLVAVEGNWYEGANAGQKDGVVDDEQ